MFPKYYSPPPKDKLIVEKRIVNGINRKVETWNGKIARVYDEEGKLLEDRSKKLKVTLPTPPLEPRKVKEKSSLQIVPEEEVGLGIDSTDSYNTDSYSTDSYNTDSLQTMQIDGTQCPECKGKNIETILHLENAKRYKCKDCGETFAGNNPPSEMPKVESIAHDMSQKMKDIINIQGITDKIDKIAADKGDKVIESKEKDIPSPPKDDISKIASLPNDDISKIASPPNDDISKIVPKNTPKEEQEMGVPGVEITKTGDRIEKLINNKTDNKELITENKSINDDKINTIKAEINQIEEKKIKENKSMAEEILEEFKRDQWAKKRDFEKNIEDMARVASENKNQISGISHKIEEVEGKLGDVDNKIGNFQENFQEKFGGLQENLKEKLGNVKKPVADSLGELCNGVDCIKNDLKKTQEFQINQQAHQDTIQKQLEEKFKELSERLEKLEEPSYVCDNCGQNGIRVLSSFCPNCGNPIHNWTDPETGIPVAGWVPWWKRMRAAQE